MGCWNGVLRWTVIDGVEAREKEWKALFMRVDWKAIPRFRYTDGILLEFCVILLEFCARKNSNSPNSIYVNVRYFTFEKVDSGIWNSENFHFQLLFNDTIDHTEIRNPLFTTPFHKWRRNFDNSIKINIGCLRLNYH